MLISAPRRELEGKSIKLEKWLLPALYLNNGNRFFYLYDGNAANSPYIELIVTSINPMFWADTWRIDITTKDKPGNLHKIIRLFDALGIDLLQSEGSVRGFGEFHEMCFICALNRYESLNDLDTISRYGRDHFRVADLELLLKVNLGDQIHLAEASAPSIKIRRLHYHREMHQDFVHRKANRQLERMVVDRLADDEIRLSGRFLSDLTQAFGPSVSFTPLADTKNRVLRLLFFPSKVSSPCYIQVVFSEGDSDLLARILEKVYSFRGNILRYQIRPCPEETVENLFGKRKRTAFSKIDLTFDFNRSKGQKSASVTFAKIVEGINQISPTKALVNKSINGESND